MDHPLTDSTTRSSDDTAPTPADRAVHWSDRRYRTLLDLAPVAVYSCDASGVIQEFNRRAVELWGRAPVPGDTDQRFCGSLKLFRPDGTFMPHEQAPMAEVVAGTRSEVCDAEVLIERPDGSRITVVVNIRPLTNERGDVTGAINCFYDITARKETEEALRQVQQVEEARALLANIVDSSDDAIVSKSLDGVITSWNAGAERIFGYTAAEAIGRSILLIVPPDRRHEETEILRRLRQGQAIEHFETQRLTKDGRLVSISLTVSPVRNRHGVVIGASKIARDITDRVRADAERARLLASEQAARAQAEEANRGKDQFLATVSHELRTPLTAILGWAAMLEQTAPADARTFKGLQSIHRNTRMLVQLVDDLLDVSRMISGKMRLDVAPMDLGDVIDAAVETILPAASAKDIGVHVSVDPASRAMSGDATRLQQAVWNLLSNAVKFTPEGGRVDVRTRVDTREVELTVSDSGIGIDATFLPYVFDRFRQADASSTRAHSGLGLGLAIVRHLVELHGGTVRAESDGRDAGTRFVMRLPRSHSAHSAHHARKPSAAGGTAIDVPRLDGVRVLVVDDDRGSCEMMLEALRGYGASLRCAMSASEAVDALSEFTPDVVVSDIAMPGRDGYAVLTEVRARDITLGRHVPVAAVTAYAHAEDRARAIAAGFDDYLAKPVEPAALARAVAALAAVHDSSRAEPPDRDQSMGRAR